VGTYRLGDTLTLKVTAADGGLEAVFGRQPALRFAPRGDGRYAARWLASELRLSDGRLTFVQEGDEIECLRVS
jgi:hypothetical protein